MATFTFSTESGDGLTRTTWGFWLDDWTLVFDSYEEDARETKRHKWRPIRMWSRIGVYPHGVLRVPRPALTANLGTRAINELIRLLNVRFDEKG